MDYDLASLETFVLLAECGSFSEVAKSQDLSQPAVTFRIAKLESLTGLRLFTRHPEGVRLTREGGILLERARGILSEHASLVVRMGHFLRENRGVVKLVIDRSETGESLAGMLAADAAVAGMCELLRPTAGQRWDSALLDQSVDLVASGSFLHSGEHPALQHLELGRQGGTTLAWSRDYFEIDPGRLRFPDLLRSAILVPSESLVPGYLPFLEKWCLECYGVVPPEVQAFDDEASARESCVAGLGVLVFPGNAECRMSLSPTLLGIARVFDFLLPDAYRFCLHLRTSERNSAVMQVAMKLREYFLRHHSAEWTA